MSEANACEDEQRAGREMLHALEEGVGSLEEVGKWGIQVERRLGLRTWLRHASAGEVRPVMTSRTPCALNSGLNRRRFRTVVPLRSEPRLEKRGCRIVGPSSENSSRAPNLSTESMDGRRNQARPVWRRDATSRMP